MLDVVCSLVLGLLILIRPIPVNNRIRLLFGVNIKCVKYDIVDHYEHWIPINGNGECFIKLKLTSNKEMTFLELKQQMINKGALPLPVRVSGFKTTIFPVYGIKKYIYHENDSPVSEYPDGLYILNVNNRDDRDFNLMIYDEIEHSIIIYLFDT